MNPTTVNLSSLTLNSLNNINTPIALTPLQRDRLLKDLDLAVINSDPMTASEYINKNISTFDEAFPGLRENLSLEGNKSIILSFLMDPQKSEKLENQNPYTDINIEKVQNDSVNPLDVNNSDPNFTEKEIESVKEILAIFERHKNEFENFEDMMTGISSFANKLEKFLKVVDDNKVYIKLALAGSLIVPPVFAYKSLFSLYGKYDLY